MKEDETSIYKSRQGYAYQDKYALLKFLQYYKQGNLINFYVDYGFKKNYSLDILAIFGNPTKRHIYEVKTGERFKTKRELLKKELNTLYEYKKKRNDVEKISIALDPKVSYEILKIETELIFLKKRGVKSKFGPESYKQVLSRCYKEVGSFLDSENSFNDFLSYVEFAEDRYSNESTGDDNSPLEKQLIGEVEDLGKIIEKNGCAEEMPYWVTIQELLEVIKQNAGSDHCLIPKFKVVLEKSFSTRKVLEEHLDNKSGVSVVRLIGEEKEKISLLLIEKFQKNISDILTSNPNLSEINNVIIDEKYNQNKEKIKNWLKDEQLGNYFLDKLPKQFDDLTEINFLLERLIQAQNPFFALNLLEKSISKKNNKYIFYFVKKHLKFLLEKENDIFGNHTTDIVNKILDKYSEESNRSFDFVQTYIKVHPSEFSDLRATREHGKQVISEIIYRTFKVWKEDKKVDDINKLVKLIGDNFNLIDDYHEFAMFTPEKIFLVLYEYIILDFGNNFRKIVEIIVGQFKDKRIGYGKEYDGKEWSGSGISQSGSVYSITDRYLVEKVLAPATGNFYEEASDKEDAWEKIKKLCLTKEKEISSKRPDFLNRAILPIVLLRYSTSEGEGKNEAFQILKEFIEMTEVPVKSHFIFQEALNSGMREEDKWNLVQASLNTKWNKNKLPVNVFVERIVSELAEKGEKKKEARELLDSWLKNDEYLKRQSFGEYNVLGIISKLLSGEEKGEGVKIFEEYIYSDAFKNKLGRFDSFDIAEKMSGILDFNVEKGLEILWKIYGQDKLSENEQILICSGINKIKSSEIRIRVYNEFLKQILSDLGNSIDRIVKKFSFDYPRTAIVEFGDELAKEKKFAEALGIAKIFINDPDPKIDDDKESNLHERLVRGEEESAITSTRGWVCWLLHQFSVLDGRDYIPEIIPLIEKLSKDPNYYIRSQACFPLAGLMRVRNSIMPGTKTEWFLSREIARKIEKIALDMLGEEENRNVKGIMVNLAYVFDSMRSMNEETALKVLELFKDNDNKFSEPTKKIAGLFIFYAEFRKDAFKGELWKDLGEFNDKPFKKMLEDFIQTGSLGARQNFLWQFMGLIKESEKNPKFTYGEAFKMALHYIKIISEKYEPEVYSNIFRFIKENLDKEYETGKNFFMECLKKEKEALVKEKIDKTWIPFYYHRDILEEIYKRGDKELFLDAVNIMSNYSSRYSYWEELKTTISHLAEYPKDDKKVDEVFDKLIENNPAYYDLKVEWKKNN